MEMMNPMPQRTDEPQYSDFLRTKLETEFDLSRRTYSFWYSRLDDRHGNSARVSNEVYNLCALLNVKACRQFRSIIELCARGEASDASVVSRALFETTIKIGFILKPKLRIVPSYDVKHGKRKRDKSGNVRYRAKVLSPKECKGRKLLTREERAMLCHAGVGLQDIITARKLADAQSPGVTRFSKRVLANFESQTLKVSESSVGKKWLYTLTHSPYTYSGLRLGPLTKVIGWGLDQWYDQVYGPQSRSVHADDSLNYIEIDEKAAKMKVSWFSPIDRVQSELHVSNAIFLICISLLQKYIGFGTAAEIALQNLRNEHVQMMTTE